jgi:FG-GAP-like repeat/IPT/TIG domain/Secretion system C-terminal sorting domain/FG-GAP repeat
VTNANIIFMKKIVLCFLSFSLLLLGVVSHRALAQAPTISSFTPTSGPVGTVVTITGSNFDITIGGNTVKFNGITATVTAATSTNLTVTVPVGANGASVTVEKSGYAPFFSLGFTVTTPPTITSFFPLTGTVGTTVTISGTNFNATAANNVVLFGATKATVTAASTTQLTVTVPVGATYAPITVLNTTSSLLAYTNSNFTPTSTPSSTASNFATTSDFATGSNPQCASIGDLDGDGKADLAVANDNSNTISVLRNTSTSGNITFATKVDFGTGNSPSSVSIGDMDGDGKSDLAVANYNSNTISVLRNTSTSGNITFATKVDFGTGNSPSSVSIGDMDGDGKADLAVANAGGGTVSVLRNTSTSGTIGFAAKVDFSTGTDPRSVAIGDLDGDGKADLAIANYSSNSVSVLRNTSTSGTISFAAKVDFGTGTGPRSVSIGDMDGDGKADLAVANFASGTISALRNTSTAGTIGFATKIDFGTNLGPTFVSIGDLNGDGKADLAIANSSFTSVLRSISTSGTIDFATNVVFPTGSAPVSVSIGDLDGDGKPDLARPNFGVNTVSVMRNNPAFPPTISSVSPSSGDWVSTVTITGTNFDVTAANNNVKLNGLDATVTAATATSLTTRVPIGATTGKITVTVNGLTATSSSDFTITPAISMVSPTSGVTGTSVTITGVNFDPIAANNIVKFNGTTAIVTASTTTSLTTTIPSGATTGRITVTVNGATGSGSVASNFVIFPSFYISSFSPTTGAEGASVVITGTDFAATTAGNTVKFNGTSATVIDASTTRLTVTVPSGATTGKISVTRSGVTVTSASDFTLSAVPTLSSFSPASGVIGTTVIITGTNLDATAANNIVKFNGITATVTSASSTFLTVTVPNGTTNGKITVEVNGLTLTSGSDFLMIPSISGFTPNSGGTGTSVVITGVNFSATAANNTVQFNGTTATVIAASATSLTTTLPSGSTTGKITVNVSGLTATSSSDFLAAPAISSFSPAKSVVGSSIFINGINFDATPSNNTVKFNGISAVVTSSSTTGLRVDVPSGGTTGKITVTVNGMPATSSSDFTVAPAPTISSFSPASALEGASLTITGNNFDPTADNNTVQFNGTTATVTAASSTSLTVTVPIPSTTTTGKITVTVNGGTATSSSDFITIPSIYTFSPSSGPAGTVVRIQGRSFASIATNSTVKFNGTTVNVVSSDDFISPTIILYATVPVGATTGKVTVTVNGLTATSSSDFTVLPAPTISSFSPTSGTSGTTVIITGTNFNATAANNTVKFNGTIAIVTAASTTSLTVTVPSGSTAGKITVTSNGATGTSSSDFTVTGIPTISSFSPNSGTIGTTVTITGTNFSINSRVIFNDTPAVVTAASATSLTVRVPSGARTGKISIDRIQSSSDFRVELPPISFAPSTGAAGSTVTITGIGFDATAANNFVYFANRFNSSEIPATVITASPTSLTVTVPTEALTGKIRMEKNGIDVYSSSDFRVVPTITSFDRVFGVVGDLIFISGTGFDYNDFTVKFNGTTATVDDVSNRSNTGFQVGVPSGATTGKITVTSNGLTATSNEDFSVYLRPNISSFSPATGGWGTTVIITGSNFDPTPSKNTVYFNGEKATITAGSATSLTVTVPNGATTGKILVSLANGIIGTSATDFTVLAPTISSFSPGSGYQSDVITISGTNFDPVASKNTVKFKGEFAERNATVTIATSTSLTTTVPYGATTGKITVTTGNGTGTSSSDFIVKPDFSFTPVFGLPGTVVTVTGKFNPIATNNKMWMTSNNIANPLVTYLTLTRINSSTYTFIVPSGAETGGLGVETSGDDRRATTSIGTFTVAAAPPAIRSFTPTSGPTGKEVTIIGDFDATVINSNIVKFNGTTATATVGSRNSLTVTVPSGATTGKITVENGAGKVTSSSDFTVLPTPVITSFTPIVGLVGTRVTLTGSNFDPIASNNTVRFNGTTAVVTAASSTSITTTVPSGATTGKITVTVNGVTGASIGNFIFGILAGVEDPAKATQVSIYPNPSDEVFNISLPEDGFTSASYQVTDLQGSVMTSGTSRSSEFSLSLKGWSAGIYLLRVNYNGKSLVEQIVKE